MLVLALFDVRLWLIEIEESSAEMEDEKPLRLNHILLSQPLFDRSFQQFLGKGRSKNMGYLRKLCMPHIRIPMTSKVG